MVRFGPSLNTQIKTKAKTVISVLVKIVVIYDLCRNRDAPIDLSRTFVLDSFFFLFVCLFVLFFGLSQEPDPEITCHFN